MANSESGSFHFAVSFLFTDESSVHHIVQKINYSILKIANKVDLIQTRFFFNFTF